jgi:plasmid maintenance system antidote protein VapI
MTSFQIPIKPRRRAAARFVTGVRRKILKALEEENQKRGLKQTDLARAIEVHRSVVNRELRGKKDLTLGRVAELAWAMDRSPFFDLQVLTVQSGSNLPPVSNTSANSAIQNITVIPTSGARFTPANTNALPAGIKVQAT